MRARREETDGDGTASTTAYYTKDEVSGPLKGLGKNEPEVTMTREKVVVKDTNADKLPKGKLHDMSKSTGSEDSVSNIQLIPYHGFTPSPLGEGGPGRSLKFLLFNHKTTTEFPTSCTMNLHF